MTDKQPEALRLADKLNKAITLYSACLENSDKHMALMSDSSDELRRLHEVNAELVEALRVVIRGVPDTWDGVKQAKAVLDKAKEKNNG